MQVHIANIKSNIRVLDTFLKTYEEDSRNYYNEIKNSSSNWQDGKAIKFFDLVNLEKIKLNTFIEELNTLKSIYSYILEVYEQFGNKIFFELNNRDACIEKINDYLNRLKQIIKAYEKLDLSFCDRERYIIEQEKQALKEEVTCLEQIKKDFKKIMNSIEEIEKNIKIKLSKINIEIVKETNLEEILR